MPETPKAALLSLSDKRGLEELAPALSGAGFHLYATGGTARALGELGAAHEDVSALTQAPPLAGGRVKTLHPTVYAAILARRDQPDEMRELHELGVPPIDVVAVDLYPFERALERGARDDELIEEIDIGGVSLLRAAAKNHAAVSVLSDPSQYGGFIASLRSGGPTHEQRKLWAAAAFARCARYDEAIEAHFASAATARRGDGALPPVLAWRLPLRLPLRYGENPWSHAALYGAPGAAPPRRLSGKELSYNNLLDLDACLRLLDPLALPKGFPATGAGSRTTRAAIVKHTIPCGVAARSTAAEALDAALGADPISAFGGIVACGVEIDASAAELLRPRFLDVVAAPSFTQAALDMLRAKKNLRVVEFAADLPQQLTVSPRVRSAYGGVLYEEIDASAPPDEWTVVTGTRPSEAQWRDLLFAFGVVRQVKSNAAVAAKDEVTLGVCGGQTNRVAAVELACRRSGDAVRGAALATDGFFPFADGLEAAAAAGIGAVVAPSGSIRDAEVVAAAKRAGIALVFTARRYFLH